MRRTLRYVVVPLALVLAVAACGDDADDPDGATSPDDGVDEQDDADDPADDPADTDDDIAAYFSGQQIRHIVTWSPGGTGDAYARILQRHFSQYIPGNPQVVVENMEGGGHTIGVNYLYNQAEPDGFTIGTFSSTRPIASAIGEEGVEFDASEFEYIGTLSGFGSVCIAWADSGVESVDDLADQDSTFIVGDVSASAVGPTAVNLIGEDLGWNAEAIIGYESTNDVFFAMETGEVDGTCAPWNNINQDPDFVEQINPLFVVGIARDPGLPDVPAIIEDDVFPLSSDVSDAVTAYVQRFGISVPVALPPGTPAHIVDAWRDAFDQVIEDPDYREETEAAGRPLEGARPGAEVAEIVDTIHDAPPEAWQRVLDAQSD